MRKKLFALGMLVVVGLMALPAAVFAQEIVSGTGELHAHGSGRAELRGSGVVNVSGQGVLVIRHRGDAAVAIEINGHGTRSAEQDGAYTVIRIVGFDGDAHIRGHNIFVSITGRDINLWAAGTGVARLRGSGRFVVNGREGRWTARGVVVQFGHPNPPCLACEGGDSAPPDVEADA